MSKKALVLYILALLTLVAYGQVVRHHFLLWDDQVYVFENPRVSSGLTLESARWAFTTTHMANWHPVTWLSHMLDVELFGMNAGGHHLMNVLLHVLSTLVLFLVFNKMTGAFWRSAFVAGLFALHPMHVESVVWVAERKDVLSTFFGFLALWAWTAYLKRRTVGRYLGVCALFVLSLLSKQMLVTLPVVLLLLDYWPLSRFGKDGPGAGRLILEKLPLFLLAGIAAAVIYVAHSTHGGTTPVGAAENLGAWGRIGLALAAVAAYAGKLFWPWPMSPIYPLEGAPPVWPVLAGLILVAGITAWGVAWRHRSPYLLTGWLWFLVTLLPVSGLVQIGIHRYADRYTYVPYTGLAIILAWGAVAMAGRRRVVLRAAAVAGAVFLVACTIASGRQAALWGNTVLLFSHAARVEPDNHKAYRILADFHLRGGRVDEAEEYFRKALAARPDHYLLHTDYGVFLTRYRNMPQKALDRFETALALHREDSRVHNGMGAALQRLGRTRDALRALRTAVLLDPPICAARNNLGNVLLALGETGQAVAWFEKTVQCDPFFVTGWTNLARARIARGELEEALSALERALRLDPAMVDAWHLRGLAEYKRGNLEKANELFTRALSIDPEHKQSLSGLIRSERAIAGAEARAAENLEDKVRRNPENTALRYALATVYRRAGLYDQAVREYMKVMELFPSHFLAHNDLGLLRLRTGDHAAALAAFKEAARIDPDSVEARYNMGCVLAKLGKREQAVERLEQAVGLGFDSHEVLLRDDDLAALRGHPGFEALVDRLRGRPDRPAS